MSYPGSLKSLLVIVLGRAPHHRVLCTFQHYLIHCLQAARQELGSLPLRKKKNGVMSRELTGQGHIGVTVLGFTHGLTRPQSLGSEPC